MKSKSLFLLLVFSCSLIPLYPANAENKLSRDIDSALALMYISDAILLDESEIDDSTAALGLFSPPLSSSSASPGDELLSRMIHAVKMERNDLGANCNLLVGMYKQADQDCEAQKIQSHCQQRKAELNNRIGQLHEIRGDRRKWGTIFWHSLKRGSSNFWYRIGPVGRRFLNRLGPEALQMAATGGLSGNVLKNLLKHTAKSMGRERIRQVVLQGVGHLLQGQISIAQAAGVDICDPDKEKDKDQAAEAMESSESVDGLEFAFQWTCSSDIGPYGAWMQGGDPNTIIDKSELIFNLQAGSTEVNYEFTFNGIVQLPQYGGEGNLYDHQKADHKSSGKGSSTWDGLYFFGSVTIDRTEHLYSLSDTLESSKFKDSYDKSVIGALSPKDNEIHLCFHTHTEEQFDSIKQEPFGNLLGHCTSSQCFVCTPQE